MAVAELLPAPACFAWLAEGDLGFDPSWPEPLVLTWRARPSHWRIFDPPPEPGRFPAFLAAGLRQLARDHVFLLPRHESGRWPSPAADQPIGTRVVARAAAALGVPDGFEGAIRLGPGGVPDLMLLGLACCLCGESLSDELYAIPADRTGLIRLSRRGSLHAQFATPEALHDLTRRLAQVPDLEA